MITVKQRPYKYNWTGNSVYYQLYSEAASADTSIFFEVRTFFKGANESDYELVATLPFAPTAGSVKFNIQDVLHAHLEYNMPDLYDDASVIEMPRQSGSFYIDFREVSATNSNPPWDSSEIEYSREIIKGGIHLFHFKGNNYWFSYHPTNMPFLTWQQSGRLAALYERMYLAWYCMDIIDIGKLVARVNVTFADNTTATKDIVVPAFQHLVYHIPSGASQLGLSLLGIGKRIWYWTIQLFDITGTPVAKSQVFKYYLDNRNDYNDVTLHYRNSLGGIDSVRVRGVLETNLNYEIVQTSGLLPSDYFMNDQLPAIDSIHKSKETAIYRGDVGHLGKEEQDRLRDAFLQRQCFRERMGKWWPVKLINTNTKLRSSKDMRWGMPIEWQYADGGSYFYTPDLDLGDGFDSDNVCDCVISGLTVDTTFGLGDTVSYNQFGFTVYCPDGDNPNTVQYRVNDGNWNDLSYPYLSPPVITLGVDQYYTVSWRVKCPSGEFGPINTIAVNAFLEAPPPPDPVPENNNFRITNRLGVTQTIDITVDGDTIWIGTLAHMETYLGTLVGSWASVLVLVETSSVTPTTALLDTGSGDQAGYILEGRLQVRWIGQTITDGMVLLFE